MKTLVASGMATLLLAGASWADEPQPKAQADSHAEEKSKANYGRSGWYLGVGAGPAFDFFEDAIQDKTMDLIEISTGGSFNARGGYRLTSWFAVELMYEGVYNLGVDILGVQVAERDLHSFVANLKFMLPFWRIHPYFLLGPGVQYGAFNGTGLLDPFDTTRWDFTLRTGGGVDAYITEHWLLNFEVAPSIRFADYSNLPSQTTDNVTLTVSGGVQYRF